MITGKIPGETLQRLMQNGWQNYLLASKIKWCTGFQFLYFVHYKFQNITLFMYYCGYHKCIEINVLITLIRLPPTQTRDSNVALTATPSISTALHIFVPVLSILIELDLLICTLNKEKLSFVTRPYHVIHKISLNPIACLERHELKKQSVFRLSNIFWHLTTTV